MPTASASANLFLHPAPCCMDPEGTGAANGPLVGSSCSCMREERILHAYSGGYGNLPPMTAEEREWCLDEIASVLEAAAIRIPDLLLSSGFDLAKERRNSVRTKPAQAAAAEPGAEQTGSNP